MWPGGPKFGTPLALMDTYTVWNFQLSMSSCFGVIHKKNENLDSPLSKNKGTRSAQYPNKRTSTTPPPTIMKDGMLFEDSNDISEQFNNYFQEIEQSIANSVCHSANSMFKASLSLKSRVTFNILRTHSIKGNL